MLLTDKKLYDNVCNTWHLVTMIGLDFPNKGGKGTPRRKKPKKSFVNFEVPENPDIPATSAAAPIIDMEVTVPGDSPASPPAMFPAPEIFFRNASSAPLADPETLTTLKEMHQDWGTSREDVSRPSMDWRAAVQRHLKSGNIEAIKQAGIISAQLKMMELCNEADSESIQYNAAAHILAQNGHGPISRVEAKVEYEKMPKDQLIAVIQAKFASLRKFIPGFDAAQLLAAPAASNEIIEVKNQEDESATLS
jgi:hypothetical protein